MPSQARHRVVVGVLLAMAFVVSAVPVASAETRTLKLYFLHTQERAEITYKRNGRYLKSGLDQVNRLLRDWRRNEPTKMDPHLLDLLWEVYRKSGSRDYIHVISAYRSPQTNAMLRKRSNGVAKKSQHMLGKAIDFYLPDVRLSKLRAVALRMEVGGVGYYPRSGSPFVHIDVGGVRHWPRMSRKELASVFPDGKTIHVPSDGKPMPGYQQALASYESRKKRNGSVQIADDSGRRKGGGGLLAAIFGGGGGADDEEDSANIEAATAPRPVKATTVQQPEPKAVQPEPEQPATILAALPPRAVPVPRAAPRPDVGVGTSLGIQPQPAASAVAAADDAPTPPEGVGDSAPVAVAALDVPIPTRRPDHTPPAQADASDAIAQVLAAAKEDPVQTASASAYVPLPSARPDGSVQQSAATDTGYVLAALPQSRPQPQPSAGGPEDVAMPAVSPPLSSEKAGRPVSASQRLALLEASTDAKPAALASRGAKTTAKAAKPGPHDGQPEPRPAVVPIKPDSTRWAFSNESVIKARATTAPSFNSPIVRAPDAVYTSGFQQGTLVADARRFTGNAVTFLSVAKFGRN